MSLREDSAAKLRKIKAKWKYETLEELEEMEKNFLKERMYSKEPTIKGHVRITAGKVKNFLIDIPKNTRPLTDRMKVRIFDILGSDIFKKNILDLYAGSGSFGLEALSRGAGFVTFVDASKHSEKIIKANIAKTGYISQSEMIKEKVEEYIFKAQKDEKTFDIIFFDPPYKLFNTKKTKRMEEIINMTSDLLVGVKNKKARFKGAMIVKHPRRYSIKDLNLNNLKEADIFDFGLNSISILIVENKKK